MACINYQKEPMRVLHQTGYVITNFRGHFDSYDGDAPFVVWNLSDYDEPKVYQVASYYPTLVQWLDKKAVKQARVVKAERALRIINQREEKNK